MRFLLVILAAFGLSAGLYAQTQNKKTAKAKTAAVKATGSRTTAARTTAHASAPAKKASVPARSSLKASAAPRAASAKTGKTAAKSWRSAAPQRPPTQQQPTPDRLKEIQLALADKGYFRGMPDGAWGTDSVDALKRFQRAQSLDADGKLSALSLRALGLGPRAGAASADAGRPPSVLDPTPAAQPRP